MASCLCVNKAGVCAVGPLLQLIVHFIIEAISLLNQPHTNLCPIKDSKQDHDEDTNGC